MRVPMDGIVRLHNSICDEIYVWLFSINVVANATRRNLRMAGLCLDSPSSSAKRYKLKSQGRRADD